jgi:Tetratricopeptide repeat.
MKNLILALLFSAGFLSAFPQELEDDVLSMLMKESKYEKAIEHIAGMEESKDVLYQQGLCYKALNDYATAITLFERLLSEYPTDTPVKLQLLDCLEAAMRYDEAIGYLDELLITDPDNAYFTLRKANLEYDSEHYPLALKLYSGINNSNSSSFTLRRIASCFNKTNRVDSARLYYSKAYAMDNKDVASALNLVKIDVDREEYVPAIAFSDAFMAADSSNVKMNILNAFAYYSLNDYEEAVKRFERCVQLGDSSFLTVRSLGISHYFLKNDSVAYPYLDHAYRQDTLNNAVLHALAITCNNLERYTESIEHYNTLLDRTIPGDDVLYNFYQGLASAYERGGDAENAIINYTRAAEYASPTQNMLLYFTLAQLYEEKLGDISGALIFYDKYLHSLTLYRDLEAEEMDIVDKKVIDYKISELNKHIKELRVKN